MLNIQFNNIINIQILNIINKYYNFIIIKL